MELKDKLRQLLKQKYGIETDHDLIKELENMSYIDLGIFVNREKEGVKSA